MPYGKTSELPDWVQKLAASKQRQYMHVFNSCASDGGDDSKCSRMATGVVKGKDLSADELVLVEEAKQYQYLDSWDFQDRQLSQQQANYNPLGASADKGCANCQFFIAPSRCAVVAGTISPTGVSDLWRAVTSYEPTALPVYVVSAPDGAELSGTDASAALTKDSSVANVEGGLGASGESRVDRAMSAVKSALTSIFAPASGSAVVPPVSAAAPLTLIKQKDGRTRFLTAWSNNFEDREGEVFAEDAHKEFVEWADASQQYPELWLWHTKGTRYGQVDWLDYTDGFVFASGLIDEGREALAEQLAKEDSGVSHGFVGLRAGKEYVMYRTYEISTLPRSNAAVWTTSFNIIGDKGAERMGFTPQKKDYLKAHGLSDDQIAASETQAMNLSKSLKELGVNWKDADLVVETPAAAPAPTSEPAAAPTAPATTAPTETAGDKAAASLHQQLLDAMTKNTEALALLAGTVKSIDDRVKAVEENDDSKIAATIAARAPVTNGVQASKDANNVVGTEQQTADNSWFGQIVAAGVGQSAIS
jgi:preprotein translocase subunit YajC